MAVASKFFRLAVAILFVYIISRDRAIFLNAARWRLGTRKQGRARAIGEKNRQVCLQQKLLAIFAGDEIRRDRRIKSPSVSWALENYLENFCMGAVIISKSRELIQS